MLENFKPACSLTEREKSNGNSNNAAQLYAWRLCVTHAGLLVLDRGTSQIVTGKRVVWYDLRCECGAKFRVTRNVATLAERKAAELCCDTCKHRYRVDRQREYARKNAPNAPKSVKKRSVPPGVTHELINGRPPMTPDAIKTMARHARKPYYRRALAILTEYVDRCVAERITPDWNRGAIEAVEQAEWEHRTGTPADADRWTRENRREGLQIVKYDIYDQPAAL